VKIQRCSKAELKTERIKVMKADTQGQPVKPLPEHRDHNVTEQEQLGKNLYSKRKAENREKNSAS
jgi:hypothetical protein